MISEKYARAGINLTTCKYYTEMRAISGKYAGINLTTCKYYTEMRAISGKYAMRIQGQPNKFNNM
jgi:hypothetical protein